jgi:hypothetical protein
MKKNGKSMKLELRRFNPSSLPDDATCVVCAKRNSGKSVLIKDLLSYHKNIPFSVVISPTESSNNFYSNFIPKMLIHDDYQTELVEKFLDRQKKLTSKKKKEIRQFGSSNIDNRALLIMDDCMYQAKEFVSSKEIREIFMNGRHIAVNFYLTMQFPLGIPPALRCNVDYVFLLKDNIKKNKERLYEHWAGVIPTYQLFEQIFDQVTENYGVMVIDNRSCSNKIEDCVFWYKADVNKEFRMCDEELWQLQAVQDMKEMHEPSNDDDVIEDNFNPNVLIKNNKNSVKINVKKV